MTTITNTKESIEVIMRQTDYTLDIAEEKLHKHNNDVMSVIREYMNPSGVVVSSAAPPSRSTNQMIYKEIRVLMDDAAKNYLLRKNE